MGKYLLVRDEKYRVDLQEEVDALVEDFKNGDGELVSYTSTKKATKDDEYFVVKVRVKYNDEKNPVL